MVLDYRGKMRGDNDSMKLQRRIQGCGGIAAIAIVLLTVSGQLCTAETAGSAVEVKAPVVEAPAMPGYLKGHESLYARDPRAAAVEWHRNAKWGLFVHYALASLRGVNADDSLKAKIAGKEEWKKQKQGTPEEYAKLAATFTAEKFDANAITDLAVAAEMRYVTFTTRHLGDMHLFRTKVSDFTSLNAPAKRDLVAEMAVQCQKKGLGLFLYCPPDVARTEPEETYQKNRTMIRELLTQYGPIAGIWLDGIGTYYEDPKTYSRINDLYALIRSLQPQCLISFKQGTGTEDFVAPEGLMHGKSGPLAEKAWAMNAGKRGDICTNMQTSPPAWIYTEGCEHLNGAQVLDLLADAFAQKSNLTINTAPLPDGSLHPADVIALRETGESIRKNGFPAPKPMERSERKKVKRK